MTVFVVTSWSDSYATPATLPAGSQPAPGSLSLPVTVANIAGDWMVAVVAWRTLVASGAPAPTVSVGDGNNWWEPLLPGSSTSSGSGDVRCSIWVAPAASPVTLVQVAPTDFIPAIACTIYDVTGMLPWVATTAVSAFANAATSVSATLGAPASQAIVFTVSASDNLSDTVSLASGGWGSVVSETASNGSDHTADIACKSAYQITAGSVTGHWTSTGSLNLADVVGAALVAAPGPQTGTYPPYYQATYTGPTSPNWPLTVYECAPGGGMQTPPDELTWVPLDAQTLSLAITQGRQYETAQLSTGEGTLVLDNPAGALIPPGTGDFAGLTAGTPVRTRQIWQGGLWHVQWTGNGSTAAPQISTGQVFAVVGGQAYTASVWVGSSAPWSSGITIGIVWRTSGGSLISTTTSSSSKVNTATLLMISNAAAPGTAALAEVIVTAIGTPATTQVFFAAAALPVPSASYLTVPPTVSWVAENGAAVSTLAAFEPDINGPPDNTPWYVPFSGFIERLPQAWDDNYRGVTEATITDAWFGVNYNPQPILPTEILNDDPYSYWPCTDATGAHQASNLAPGNTNPLLSVLSKYGSGSSTANFGQNSSALLGAQSTTVIATTFRVTQGGGMWQQTLPSTTPIGLEGFYLSCADPGFPPLAAGVTFEVWFQIIPPYPTVLLLGDTCSVMTVGTAGTTFFSVLASVSGTTLSLVVGPGLGGAVYNIGAAGVDYQNMAAIEQLVITCTTTAWTTYINGTKTASGTWAVPGAFDLIQFCGGINIPTTVIAGTIVPIYNSFSGYVGQAAVFPRILHVARIVTHYQAGVTAMAGEPAYYRIERLLQAGNATGRRVIQQEPSPDQDLVVSCQDIPGQPASSSISNITGDLLPGLFFVAPTGDLVYAAKYNSYNQPVLWVLGDSTSTGEYGFENDINFDYDPSRVINQIQLTQLDDQSVTAPSVTAIEAASQQQEGTISDLATAYLQGDANYGNTFGPGLLDLANWLACTYQAPMLRLTQVTVDAASQPSAWPFVLGASAGDMVTVNRRQFSTTPLITVTGRITQTQRTLQYDESGVTGSVTCVIDPAPEENALTCDDPVRGLLSGSNVLGW